MVWVELLAEGALALGLRERVGLLAVVAGALFLVDDVSITVGERFPVQKSDQLGVVCVILVRAAGPFADVLLVERIKRHGGGDLGEHGREELLL